MPLNHQMILGTALPSGGGSDADADAYLLASENDGDAVISSATTAFVLGLKEEEFWDDMPAIWPFNGGTADKHKWNLKDPRDLDAAFRLTYGGVITHDANGFTGNGSSGFANTHLIPSAVLTLNDFHVGVYVRNNITGSVDIGCESSSFGNQISLGPGGNNGQAQFYAHAGDTNHIIQVNVPDVRGFSIGTRTAINDMKLYRDGAEVGSRTTNNAGALATSKMYIGAMQSPFFGGAYGHSNHNLGIVTVGPGLTAERAAVLTALVDAYQTALGRNV